MLDLKVEYDISNNYFVSKKIKDRSRDGSALILGVLTAYC